MLHLLFDVRDVIERLVRGPIANLQRVAQGVEERLN
jgi:hypothetical protein